MSGPVKDVPPNNVEAEKALLSCLFLDPVLMGTVAREIRPDDFYARVHERIYSAMLRVHLAGKIPDPVLVVTDLRHKGHLDDVGGIEGLSKIIQAVSDPANAQAYADLIVDAARKREHYTAAHELLAASMNGHTGSEVQDLAQSAIDRIKAMFAPPPTASLFQKVVMTATDQTPWILRGYLARRAVTLLSAHPKAGKTTFAYGIVAALQRGDSSFLDLAIPSSGIDAMVLSEEDDSVLAETFRAMKVDPDRVLALPRSRAFPRRRLAEVVDAALAALKANPNIGLVIVDTWRFWANLPDKGSNDADMVGKAFAEIMRLAAANVAVLVLHHTRKADGEEGTAASGSNALTGSADILMELRRFGKGESNTMRSLKAYGRFQRIPEELIIDLREGEYVACGEASTAREKQAEDRIASCLVNSARWLETKELMEAVGMNTALFTKTARSLVAKKAIQRIGTGKHGSPFLYASLDVPLHKQPTPSA